jgi:hypothetical protein
MRVLKDLFKPKPIRGKRWTNDPSQRPWFDQPDAMRILERRRTDESLGDKDFEALRHWAEYGYIVTEGVVPEADVEGMLNDLDAVWTTKEPISKLVIDDLRLLPEDPVGFPHEKLVVLDQDTKERLKRECHWRIHAFCLYSQATRRIFENAELIRLCSLVLGRQANPLYTINFTFGSMQTLHQDSAVFFIHPMDNIIGAWLACEDIHPDSGPLVYYPGSQKEELFTGFDNYPQTNLKTCDRAMMDAYNANLERVASRYERKTFIAKKGQVFLWHGMLIHGGDAIRNPSLTRKSYVCHYIPPGMSKESEMAGPFNW